MKSETCLLPGLLPKRKDRRFIPHSKTKSFLSRFLGLTGCGDPGLRLGDCPVLFLGHNVRQPVWGAESSLMRGLKGFPVATLLATPRLMLVGVDSTARACQFKVSLSSSSLDSALLVKPSASRGSRAPALTA
eukprot:scaffold162830_cov52-Attheya_sp.AAC.8